MRMTKMILQYISSERHTINVYKRPSEPGEIVVLSTADLKKILLPPPKNCGTSLAPGI